MDGARIIFAEAPTGGSAAWPSAGPSPALPGFRAAIVPVPDGIYGREDVALWLGISPRQLDRLRSQGRFPAGFPIDGNAANGRRRGNSRSVRWKGSVLIQHAENLQQQALYRAELFK